jgi:hypothetical protein
MNAQEWRTELEELYLGLKQGKIKPPVACEMNNTIGKIINLTKLELEYHKMTRQMGDASPTILLLEQSDKQAS